MKRFVLVLVVLLFAACSGDVEPQRPDPEPAPSETAPTESPTEEASAEEQAGRMIPIQLWYLTGGDRESPELFLHHVEVPATEAIGRAAIEMLIRGVPGGAGRNVYSIVPGDTELLGLTISNGTATIDLSRAFEDTGMGTTVDGMQVAQVVYTLTQFPTVKRVEFLLEGEPVESLGGHGIILDGPQSRKDWEQSLPPIVVESPHAGEEVADRVFMTGIANVFEATVSYRFRSETGRIIQEGFTTATCGTGCYGTFSQMIPLEFPPQPVVLEVFESSAEDGRPLHMVRIALNEGSG